MVRDTSPRPERVDGNRRTPDFPQGARRRRPGRGGGGLLAGADRDHHPAGRPAGRRGPGRGDLVCQRVRRMPERMRHPGAHPRGPGNQDRGQSGPPGQPGSALRPRPGRAAGSVQPGSLPRPAAATNDQCRGRTVGLRSRGLGGGGTRSRGAHPHAGGERQRGPHRGRHTAVVGDAGRAGRPLDRRRRRGAPTSLRSVRLRTDAGRAPAGLRPVLRSVSRLRPCGSHPVVRRRLHGDLALDREPVACLRRGPPPGQRTDGARSPLRAPALADRVERGRVDPHRAGLGRRRGRCDGAHHRGGGAGPGGRNHR